MAWTIGNNYLGAGASGTYFVSWGDTDQGLQYIMAAATTGSARLDVTAYGMHRVPQFGANPRVSYWIDVTNRGPQGTNFVLTGQRVG